MKRHLPNLITLVNLFSGCLAITFLFQGYEEGVLWCVGVSLLADLLDGMVARLLHSTSKMGKELDSLADLVSFGVLPGFMLYQMANTAWLAYVMLLIPIFAAFRLAKFNIDSRQNDYFLGLPTPAMTIGVLGLYMGHRLSYDALFQSWQTLLPIAILLSGLMVSEVPLLSLKFNNFQWQEQWIKVVFVLVAVALSIFLFPLGLSLSIVLYVLLSLLLRKRIIIEQ